MKKTIQLLQSKWRDYLIELIVIIVGILLAIALNEWNATRKDRQKEKIILQQIHKEFLFNKEQLEEIVAFHQMTFDNCRKILERCPIDSKTVNLDSLQLYIFNSGMWSTYNPSLGTIEALLNTSSFEIISDEKLRMLLIQWKDLVNDYLHVESQAIEQNNNFYKPFRSKHFPRDIKNLPFFSLKDPRMNKSILQSFEFENQVIDRMASLRNTLRSGNLEKVQQAIDEILKLTEPKKS